MGTHRTFIATYIMVNGRNGATYLGMTANLTARVWRHWAGGAYEDHSKTKGCTRLVWFERHEWVVDAIRREKQIKKWKRDWKLKWIEDANPGWLDLAADWHLENDSDWTPPHEAG